MSATPHKTHRELLDSREPGCGFPGEVFSRQDVFENDLDVFFSKLWILAGVTADIPEPGDVSTVEVGRASIMIVRDDDENIRTYRNVCRHRGSRIMKEAGKASVGMLVCPYHQWTYDLDGSLKHAAHMGQDFNAKCKSLIPVHTKVIGSHIYVCLADQPPEDVTKLDEAMTPRFAPHQMERTKIAFEAEIIENGNWKLVIENNRECYHCEGTHPELSNSFLPEDFGYCLDGLGEEAVRDYEAYTARNDKSREDWERDGFICELVEAVDEKAQTNFRTQRLVIAGSNESQTISTRVASTKLLGDLQRRDLGDVHLWGHNSWTHVMSDHAVVAFILPIGPDKTVVRTKWLVHEDAVEGVDYDVQTLTEVWVATTRQDADLVANTHNGTQDPAYVPGPYSRYTETALDQFCRWYDARLSEHDI
ncbi:aromatic ring-hydroxylating dioxygenase subunit alpha [Caballeronia sp. LZ065]|uniref:aromatic ring-hydroxylating oxygenase subunit alpha n=1 Tax=Caballeronia sp. LZ065 TaxID=3038571 RepID=UPI00285E619D|nr:aromatic ring-hydroxylating dioxygenase subunit alpha [Caballeronia sp. LZ065]MDR5782988.1 aromatic ring-hydroxylating dioxygenase subunit alpha [Caballeronia sp. LZ065]